MLWLATQSQAGVINGSFESWDLLGWSFQADEGTRAASPVARPAGAGRTISTWGEDFGFNPGRTAATGHRFLALNTRAHASFLGNDTYDITASQTFTLNQGQILSGWSFFFSKDPEPLDSAWVRVLGMDRNLVGAVWSASSGEISPTLIQGAPAWTQWQWTAPATGEYTLQLGMTTSGANNGISYGCFDGVAITTQPVPEPTAIVFGLLGGCALLALRHRNR
jgi:hypothetical protein